MNKPVFPATAVPAAPWWKWMCARLFGRRHKASHIEADGTAVAITSIWWRGEYYVVRFDRVKPKEGKCSG